MKLNQQIEWNQILSKEKLCKLLELSDQISKTVKNIIDTSDELSNKEKEQLEWLDHLSILKMKWHEKLIKLIIEVCINSDSAIIINNMWRLYQLEVMKSKYHIEVQKWLNTKDKRLYSITDKNMEYNLWDDLVMLLSCSENKWSYYVLYKVQNFDLQKDI
jgi:hypothetical protein